MYLARVDGHLTATVKHETLAGCRLLVAMRLEPDGRASGEPVVVIDRVGARRGTTVLVSTDGDAVPARLSVVGIVDDVTVERGR